MNIGSGSSERSRSVPRSGIDPDFRRIWFQYQRILFCGSADRARIQIRCGIGSRSDVDPDFRGSGHGSILSDFCSEKDEEPVLDPHFRGSRSGSIFSGGIGRSGSRSGIESGS